MSVCISVCLPVFVVRHVTVGLFLAWLVIQLWWIEH